MNTWRDIKADPPKDMQSALVTDGEGVWAGLIRRYGSDYTDLDKIYATNLGDGSHDVLYLEDLTEWQPAPATFQPDKTADEMFRELGYEKVDDLEDNVTRYVRYPYEIRWIQGRVFKLHNGYGKDGLTGNEVLACAQLLREMEADNG